jgi:deoxyinosine 3'endonuclease (endonuclease V)
MRNLHEWNLSFAEARRVQTELAGWVEVVPLEREPELITGLDCAFSRDGRRIFAAAVVLRVVGTRAGRGGGAESFEFEPVEMASATREAKFPYIPGLSGGRGEAENPAGSVHG